MTPTGRAAVALCLGAQALCAAGLAVPSKEQLEWHHWQVGAMITWNLQSLCVPSAGDPRASSQRCQKLGWVPTVDAARAWNPSRLDTDQWVEAAVAFGAQYVVLVADHMTGFALWDTQAHNFSMAHTAWRGGGGDVVKEFAASCKKYGVRPAVFYSTHYNWWAGVSNYVPGWPALGGRQYTAAEFDELAAAQLTELLTSYAGLVEVWFDGGMQVDRTPKARAVVERLAPRALCHSCQGWDHGHGVRWMGNEEGVMPLPSWGASTGDPKGDPRAAIYQPPSVDTVLSEHYWFWYPGIEEHRKTTHELVSNYLTSVGRSANLMLNIAPDDTGAVPEGDMRAYHALGAAVRCLFNDTLFASSAAAPLAAEGGYQATYTFPSPLSLRNVSVALREDIRQGQAVGGYTVALVAGGAPVAAYNGTGIGYHRLVNLAAPGGAPFRADALVVTARALFADAAALAGVAVYDWAGKEECDG